MTGNNNWKDLLWYFLRPYKFDFLILFILGIIIAIVNTINLALLYPILSITTGQTYESGNLIFKILSLGEQSFATIFSIKDPLIASSLLFIITSFFTFIFNIIYLDISLKISTKITIENKEKIFEKYINSDYQLFVDNKQGDLIYKVTRAPQSIADVFSILTKFFCDLLLSVSVFILLLSISITGTVAVLLIGFCYYLLTKYLSLKVSYLSAKRRYEASEKENVTLNEYFNGVKQIKASESSNLWKKQFNKYSYDFWTYSKKDSFWLQVPSLILYLLIFVAIGSVIITIKLLYPANFIAYLPILGTFSLAILQMLPKLANFGGYQMGIMGALPNLQAVREMRDNKSYNNIPNGDLPFSSSKPSIFLKDIGFSYKRRDNTLQGVTLSIESGKTTAIVGPSGSGKSTIIDLILRLYDVSSGEILIDNVNIKDYDLKTLREKIGFVSQDTFIFNASIQENISFGYTYTLAEIIESAKLANAHDFIMKLPDQYNTIVGDRGQRLSGGERQRIALARAIIRKPEILILDEATSSLDNIAEKAVQEAIRNVAKKCTTLIIAHRLSTIVDADEIYVLKDGKILESGTHDELMNMNDEYCKMYTTQLSN